MTTSRFEVFKTTDEQYAFNLIAANGEVVLTSERYTSRSAAENGVAAVRDNAPIEQRYDRRRASDGQHYFVLRGGNHEVIGTSEMYTTTAARDDGIDAVRRSASAARLER
jgi:hypothetical protein